MPNHDEALAIIRGQIDTHKKKQEDIQKEIANHEKAVLHLRGQSDHFATRIHNLNTSLETLHALPR